MIRKFFPLLLSVFLFLSIPLSVSASVVGGTYLSVSTSELGSIKIYIDDQYSASFGLNGDLPVLLRSSSIYGYVLDDSGSTVYRITIAPYNDTWSYRPTSSSSYSSYDLTVLSYDRSSSNISVSGLDFDQDRLVPYLILFLGLLVLMVLWYKK